MSAEPVLIEDDDVEMEPVLVLDDDEDDDTIILDDDTVPNNNNQTSNSDVIIITDKNKNRMRRSEKSFIRCLKSNNLMDKVVKKCLSMENSSGMPRVIDKTLLPLYKDANNRYKESSSFQRLLKKIYKLLVKDPDHKFLHLKTLCEELKSGVKRKVPFVTLSTNLKRSRPKGNIEINSSSNTTINKIAEEKKSQIDTVINVTENSEKSDTCDEVIIDINASNTHLPSITDNSCNTDNGNEKTDVINLDNSDSESVISLDHEDGRNEVLLIEKTASCDKESDNSKKVNKNIEIENDELYDSLQTELLIPQNHKTQEETLEEGSSENEKLIAKIERKIAVYKIMIAKLEESEVTYNNAASPYIQCSNLKKKIVDCYKQLCRITGNSEELAKRREIRLYVAQGHPAGPAKRLEDFLNDTIDSSGAVAFPDFNDVLQCVIQASIHDGLGWNRQQIFQEAAALFRQCGQALRKRRQKREYKDLLSLLQDKPLTDDPAEIDPLLLAKLEENKLIAKVKEEEILERYVNMENHVTRGQVLNPRLGNIEELGPAQDSDEDTDSGSEPDSTTENIMSITYVPNLCEIVESSSNNETILHNAISVIGESSNNNLIIFNSPDNTKAPVSDHNKSIPNSKDLDKVLVINGSCSLNDIQNYISCSSHNAVVENNDISKKLKEIQVANVDIKTEPLDVQSMLDELGENFESTVFDIEDPFLIIEISSDGFSDDDS